MGKQNTMSKLTWVSKVKYFISEVLWTCCKPLSKEKYIFSMQLHHKKQISVNIKKYIDEELDWYSQEWVDIRGYCIWDENVKISESQHSLGIQFKYILTKWSIKET